MSAPAGWYPQPDGRLRYWDGSAWTTHFAADPAAVQANDEESEHKQQIRPISVGSWLTGRTSVGLGAGLLGVLIGSAIVGGGQAPTQSVRDETVKSSVVAQGRALKSENAELETANDSLETKNEDLRTALSKARSTVKRVKVSKRKAIARERRSADKRVSAAKASARSFTSTPKTTTGGGSGGGASDPRFSYCYEANDAGYGPYRRGSDPEYAWYDDNDNDGLVCES